MSRIIDDIQKEVKRAKKKFPAWPSDPLHAIAVVNEEVGELNQAILQAVYEPQKSDIGDVRNEAIQSVCTLLRFLESLDKCKYNFEGSRQHLQSPEGYL